MVNNSTNINNDISHQIIEHRKVPDRMTLEIQVLTWYMPTYVASGQTHICSNRKCIIENPGPTLRQTDKYSGRKCIIHIVNSV
jgi:hypothetical protein